LRSPVSGDTVPIIAYFDGRRLAATDRARFGRHACAALVKFWWDKSRETVRVDAKWTSGPKRRTSEQILRVQLLNVIQNLAMPQSQQNGLSFGFVFVRVDFKIYPSRVMTIEQRGY
jgi:hypothetical protein